MRRRLTTPSPDAKPHHSVQPRGRPDVEVRLEEDRASAEVVELGLGPVDLSQ